MTKEHRRLRKLIKQVGGPVEFANAIPGMKVSTVKRWALNTKNMQKPCGGMGALCAHWFNHPHKNFESDSEKVTTEEGGK